MREGDVIVLRGPETELPDRLRALGILPLAERSIALGSSRNGQIALAILLITIVVVGLESRACSDWLCRCCARHGAFPRCHPARCLQSVEWPIIVMLAAIIPVSATLQKTGITDILSTWLATLATGLPAWGAVALILVTAMAVTPFLNNAATVLIMAPIASTFAKGLGYKPDAFLMAVAIGAACDFLTPIGHQCNTLVMGPGGYKFTDYARLGAPLSLLIIIVGVRRSCCSGRSEYRDCASQRMVATRHAPIAASSNPCRLFPWIRGDMAMPDLIVTGARVIDPSQNHDAIADVAFTNGKVSAFGKNLKPAAHTDIRNLSGYIVTPGLIDLHTHVYWGGTSLGIDADEFCRTSGVTTSVDTGSAGPGNWAGFRKHVIEPSQARILAYLHVSFAGIYGVFQNRDGR